MSRTAGKRKPLKYFIIACEGTKTESLYFGSFPLASKMIVKGGQYKSIINKGISHYSKKKKELGKDTDIELWCIFDEDGDQVQFKEAIRYVDEKYREGIKIFFAGSNESFELWYCLHFKYSTAQDGRMTLITKLNGNLQNKYDKCMNIYSQLINKQEMAIKNSEKIIKYNIKNGREYYGKPSTYVYKLVNALNSEAKKKRR